MLLLAASALPACSSSSESSASTAADSAASTSSSSSSTGSDADSSGTDGTDNSDASSSSGTSSGASAGIDAADSLAAQDDAEQFASGEDVVIAASDVTEAASYYDYDAEGTTVQVLAVQASDGTVRVALNTCQVCAGSSKAYFVQEGSSFVCQNCGNAFDADEVGEEDSGCNPVPVTSDDYSTDGDSIAVPASFLEQYAAAFANWKA